MRMLPLMILLLISGGIAFVFINKDTREWVLGMFRGAKHAVQGYTPAKTPREAMEQFAEAIKDRNYTAAAIYVSDDYAKLLEKGSDAAGTIGGLIDKATNLAKNKGFITDKFTAILRGLDPFPAPLKIVDLKHKEGESKAIGVFAADFELLPAPPEMRDLDLKMFQNCLAHPKLYLKVPIEIRKDADDVWKMHLSVEQPQHDAVKYYDQHYKSYQTGLKQFCDTLNREQMLKDQVVGELTSVLRSSK